MGLSHRGDPFSQPHGSSAFSADAVAGLNFEPKGADRIAPTRLNSPSSAKRVGDFVGMN